MGLLRRHRAPLRAIKMLALAACLDTAAARDDIPPPPPLPAEDAPLRAPRAAALPNRDCTDCGVIRSIREVTREKKTRDLPAYVGSQEYRDTRAYSPPVVGPVFGMTFGPGGESHSYVGAMGSPEMRARMLEIVYEVIVRFDDGRFGRYELPERGVFRIDDRVRVVDNTLERLPR
jgi:hypothetical protein